jgi:hypothetical protein
MMAEGKAVVNPKEILVHIGVEVVLGDRVKPIGDLSISGDLVPAPASPDDWWVRVEGVFLDARREGEISRSGHFSISGLEMGTYLVEVFKGAKLQHVETVEIDSRSWNTSVKISLINSPSRLGDWEAGTAFHEAAAPVIAVTGGAAGHHGVEMKGRERSVPFVRSANLMILAVPAICQKANQKLEERCFK